MRSRFLLISLGSGLLVVPLHTWLMLGGNLAEYVQYDTLPGQVLYVFSKLCALFAIELFWLQAMSGLLRHRLVGSAAFSVASWRRAHGALGLAALVSIVAHVALFVAATSMRNRSLAIDLVLPWGHGNYRTWVAFGAAGLWVIVLGALVQLARLCDWTTRLWLHRMTLAATILVGIHSVAIGSESRSGAMVWMYWGMGVLLVIALLDRLQHGRRAYSSGGSLLEFR